MVKYRKYRSGKKYRILLDTLVKKRADVQGATANSLGHASNGVAMGEVDLLIIDEIGMMTFAEFCLVVASIDVNNIIGIGDETQLQPVFPMDGYPSNKHPSIKDPLISHPIHIQSTIQWISSE